MTFTDDDLRRWLHKLEDNSATPPTYRMVRHLARELVKEVMRLRGKEVPK